MPETNAAEWTPEQVATYIAIVRQMTRTELVTLLGGIKHAPIALLKAIEAQLREHNHDAYY